MKTQVGDHCVFTHIARSNPSFVVATTEAFLEQTMPDQDGSLARDQGCRVSLLVYSRPLFQTARQPGKAVCQPAQVPALWLPLEDRR